MNIFIFKGDDTHVVKVKSCRKRWRKRRAARRVFANIGIADAGISIEGELEMIVNLEVDQQFSVSLKITDRRGNPATIQPGSLAWTSSDQAVLDVTPTADDAAQCRGLSEGPWVVSVTGDADLGEGVTQITGILSGNVNAPGARAMELVAGTVEDIPDAPEEPEQPPA